MAFCNVSQVEIRGVATAVPVARVSWKDSESIFGSDAKRIANSIGVEERRIASEGICSSDLCYAAAEKLITEGGFDREEIGAVIFLSQTPDYTLPATACLLQARLGLSDNCAAFDVNLGCSGYVYGLWVASSLAANLDRPLILLLVGDTISKLVDVSDRSVSLLFGDAGSATLLSRSSSSSQFGFVLGSDGTGADAIIVPGGRYRNQSDPTGGLCQDSISCSDRLKMDGAEVFTFTLDRVINFIRQCMEFSNIEESQVDYFLLHQANQFLLEHLRKKMGIQKEKWPIGLRNYGNTSCASIPLLMTTEMRQNLISEKLQLVLAGFGVGLSWAAVSLRTNGLIMPELVEV